uniref:NADH dehydrogenase subunit 2 n=1 Tax=Parascaphoidella transversa TaxID=2914186 RepID=UPI001EE00A18|nr:NADH dehydrogenase subunit 2 [Parascaphoidella transversa]UKE80326.1 NADH dehydrogenase subunit 2 [Parascaphoidella transversa]
MLFNSSKLLLANTMMIGVIMTICSNNWISMWMGLELSLLSFIPFIQTDNLMSSESMIKYFIIQSVASTMMLFSVVIMLIGVNMMNETIMTIAMLMKLGSVPFHNWVLMIIEMLSYYTMFSLLTILKAPPLLIMYQINSMNLFIPIILSMIFSAILCLNQASIRKTLAYSSIFNISLMLIIMDSMNMLVLYLAFYSIMMITMTNIIKNLKINFINQMVMNEFNNSIKMNLWINMLSMSGFPPMIGFLGKMMVIQTLIQKNEFLLLLILLLSSMLVTMFYTRMAFTSMMLTISTKKWNKHYTSTLYYPMVVNIIFTPVFISLTSIL